METEIQPLLDSDVLLYEIGYASEAGWQQPGFPPWEYVQELLEQRIANICAIVEATAPPIFFFTGKGNFRNDIAKTVPYKERPSLKPFHYKNIKAYIKGKYDWRIQDGLEADDLLAIEQTRRGNTTIICTRDKDLFNFPGWKYSWELGKQPQRGPLLVTELGTLEYDAEKKKLKGDGGLFFFAQCLMGDPVDTIPGLPKIGPKKAFDVLFDCVSREDALNRVLGMYEQVYAENARERLLEQARLLHMVQKRVDNKILLWGFPNEDYEDWYDIDTRQIERTSKLQPRNGIIQEIESCGN